MFCMKCGKELEEGAQFCPNCGEKYLPFTERQEREIVVVREDSEEEIKVGDTTIKTKSWKQTWWVSYPLILVLFLLGSIPRIIAYGLLAVRLIYIPGKKKKIVTGAIGALALFVGFAMSLPDTSNEVAGIRFDNVQAQKISSDDSNESPWIKVTMTPTVLDSYGLGHTLSDEISISARQGNTELEMATYRCEVPDENLLMLEENKTLPVVAFSFYLVNDEDVTFIISSKDGEETYKEVFESN